MVGLPPLRQQDYLRLSVASIARACDGGFIVSEALRREESTWVLLYPQFQSKTAEYSHAKFQILPGCWNKFFIALQAMWKEYDPTIDLEDIPLLMNLQQQRMSGTR